MHVTINTGAVPDAEVPITNSAADKVRMSFNPSSNEQVDRIKALAAALISECEDVFNQTNVGETKAQATLAMRHVQTASMWSVLAATGPKD